MTDLLTRFVKWLIAPALRQWCEENGVHVPGCSLSEYNQRRREEMAAAGVAVLRIAAISRHAAVGNLASNNSAFASPGTVDGRCTSGSDI